MEEETGHEGCGGHEGCKLREPPACSSGRCLLFLLSSYHDHLLLLPPPPTPPVKILLSSPLPLSSGSASENYEDNRVPPLYMDMVRHSSSCSSSFSYYCYCIEDPTTQSHWMGGCLSLCLPQMGYSTYSYSEPVTPSVSAAVKMLGFIEKYAALESSSSSSSRGGVEQQEK